METNQTNDVKWKYRQISQELQKVFAGFSSNYRQKLVYNLLNAIKGNDQKEFFWLLLRALNAKLGEEEANRIFKQIIGIYPLSSSEFEKVAYSVVLGIMSAGGGKSE